MILKKECFYMCLSVCQFFNVCELQGVQEFSFFEKPYNILRWGKKEWYSKKENNSKEKILKTDLLNLIWTY